MSLKVDLEILGKLSATLHDLAQKASEVKAKNAPDTKAEEPLLAGTAAAQITRDLIQGALIPTAKERLSETGDVMTNVAKQFKDKDDSAADALVQVYSSATGNWTVEQPK
ncbi:hypothetical protein [Nocardia transvalensis]|uniref:hypothetical protein n=1 Tax=Nocardia transvalensis TaxID=37333 RepID=UPI0018958EE1|nr:hypothetical protein [Nocardia transvalensis]MBF6331849.1 hypothetical protein [Nocardia transvalensis]